MNRMNVLEILLNRKGLADSLYLYVKVRSKGLWTQGVDSKNRTIKHPYWMSVDPYF
jgi:hypothetical protein